MTACLVIVLNPALVSLAGLESMTSIGGSLQVADNDALATLDPLHAWRADVVEGQMICDTPGLPCPAGINITRNAQLPQCEVDNLDAEQTNPDAACPTSGIYQCIENNGSGTCGGSVGQDDGS